MAGTSVSEILVPEPISLGVGCCAFSLSLFPVDGALIQWHFSKNQSQIYFNAQEKFLASAGVQILGLNPGPCWKQFMK